MTSDYFRALAARCRTSARSCFDLYAKEEFGRLASEFDSRAIELDAPSETRLSIGSVAWRRNHPRGFAGDN
jgi:hypothetical protein